MCMKGKWKQYGFAFIITCALVSAGAVIGWSVQVPRINEDPNNSFNLTLKDQEWLVASVGLASLLSSFFAGWLIECFGPCRLLQMILLPASISWIVMATSGAYGWLMTGRIITGIFLQIAVITIQPFLAELSESDIRGSILCLPEIMFSFGMLVMYIFARFLPWENGTLITGVLIFPVIALYLYVPESPYWCIRKLKFSEAARSLARLRSPGHDVEAELKTMKEAILDGRDAKETFLMQILSMKDPANYRPTLLLSTLFLLRELSGALLIFTYSPFFFSNAGVPIDPFSATVLVGFARLSFGAVSATMIDVVGRRTLFLCSSLVCSFMMLITGFVLQYPYQPLTWIPLIAVIIFVAFFALGVGPIPWVLIGEMLPTPVRSVASSICNSIFCTLFYLEAFYFSEIVANVGLAKLVLGLAFFNFLTALTVWLFLPETRHRTLEDLQTAFAGATLRPFKKQRKGYLQPYGTTFSTRTKLIP